MDPQRPRPDTAPDEWPRPTDRDRRDARAAKRLLRHSLRAVGAMVAADPALRARRSAAMWPDVAAAAGVASHRGGGPATQGRAVMVFESLPGEPDTETWMSALGATGWTVAVPVVEGPELRIVPVGRDGPDVAVADVVAVVVPGLGFTRHGVRIGQGGGHYDRFLGRLPASVVTVGVCFVEQLLDEVPSEPHDVAVAHVVAG